LKPEILFIIGAGASAASSSAEVRNLLYDPPLANNMANVLARLFEALYKYDYNKLKEIGITESEYNSWKAFRMTIGSEFQHLYDDYSLGSNVELSNNFEYIWTLADMHSILSQGNKVSLETIIQEKLRKFILIVLRAYFAKYDSINYMILAEYLKHQKSTCISFNWDTLLDRTIIEMYGFHPSVIYGKSVRKLSEDNKHFLDSNHQVKILKPHGSSNWVKTPDRLLKFPKIVEFGQYEHVQIIPPSYYKFRYMDDLWGQNRKGFKDIFTECCMALQQSNILVVIGYSFPMFDLEAEYLFRRYGENVRRVIVFDINPEKIAPRLVNLFPNCKMSFIGGGFQEFSQLGRLNQLDDFILG
jgi:hypothetical protein